MLNFLRKLWTLVLKNQYMITACFFTKKKNIFTALSVYVDDILVISSDSSHISKEKGFLHAEYTIKDLGAADFFSWDSN